MGAEKLIPIGSPSTGFSRRTSVLLPSEKLQISEAHNYFYFRGWLMLGQMYRSLSYIICISLDTG